MKLIVLFIVYTSVAIFYHYKKMSLHMRGWTLAEEGREDKQESVQSKQINKCQILLTS